MSVIGTIYEDMKIPLDEETLRYGGAWWNDGRAYHGHMLKAFVERFKDRKDVVTLLDVGASTGAYALMAAYLPCLDVFAFEPDERAYDVLARNIELNRLQTRVFPFFMAVGAEVGRGTYHRMTDEGAAGLGMLNGVPRADKATEPVDIEVTTVDHFCGLAGIERVDVLKVDVEGGDLFVLQGAAAVIERDHPLIIVEYSAMNTAQYGYNPDSIEAFLRERGYTWTVESEDLIAEWSGG